MLAAVLPTTRCSREIAGFGVRYARPEERFVYLAREGAELMLEQSTGRTFRTPKVAAA